MKRCESITENIGIFVEHDIKHSPIQYESYLKDTPDFLRQAKNINKKEKLPPNAILVTLDISGLYTNITHSEGINCTREALNSQNHSQFSTEFIIRLLELVLEYNIFEFDGEYYQQLIGTAMGSRLAPSYANIFLANKIDLFIWKLSAKLKDEKVTFTKRFLDDLFLIFVGTTRKHHIFCDELTKFI